MSDVHHRPGVHEAFLMKRHLKLEALEGDKVDAIAQEIDQLVGVDTVALDLETQCLDIAYDASVLQIEQIEAIINKHGSDLDHGWWSRFKESWYSYTDRNVRDNAHHEPRCCSKIPPRK